MKLYLYLIPVLLLGIFASCSDNAVNTQTGDVELLYQKQGLIDSVVGTCSTFLIRNFELDTIDFSNFRKARLEKESFTDGDLSEIIIYYRQGDSLIQVFNLSGKKQINSMESIEMNIPQNKQVYYLRLKLFSSTCTGELFHLKLRNLKIYGVK